MCKTQIQIHVQIQLYDNGAVAKSFTGRYWVHNLILAHTQTFFL